MLILVSEAQASRLRPVFRLMVELDPEAAICTSVAELSALPEGSLALLAYDVVSARELNWVRPMLAQRALRVVLWSSTPIEILRAEAPDAFDWISHIEACPRGMPEFVQAGLELAPRLYPAVAWRGGGLGPLLGSGVRRVAASAPPEVLLAAAREPGPLAFIGVASQAKLRRIRWTLARTRREDLTLLEIVEAELECGLPTLRGDQLELEEAIRRLKTAGVSHPAKWAVSLDLEPEALQLLVSKPGARGEDEWRAALESDDGGAWLAPETELAPILAGDRGGPPELRAAARRGDSSAVVEEWLARPEGVAEATESSRAIWAPLAVAGRHEVSALGLEARLRTRGSGCPAFEDTEWAFWLDDWGLVLSWLDEGDQGGSRSARVSLLRGRCSRLLSRLGEAEQALEESLTLAKSDGAGSDILRPDILLELAAIHLSRHETGRAREEMEEALEGFQARGALGGQANTLLALGDLHLRMDALGEAKLAYEAALKLFVDIGDKLGQASTLEALGDLHLRTDALGEAKLAYEAALKLFVDIDDKLGQANTRKAHGDLHLRTAALGEAKLAYEAALKLFVDIDDKLGQANTLQAQGLLQLAENEPARAIERFVEVLGLHRGLENRPGEQAALGYLARTAASVGAFAQALLLAEASLERGRAIDDRFGQSITVELQRSCFAQREDVEGLVASTLLLRVLAEEMGEPEGAAACRAQLSAFEQALPKEAWTELVADPEAARLRAVQRARVAFESTGRELFAAPDNPDEDVQLTE